MRVVYVVSQHIYLMLCSFDSTSAAGMRRSTHLHNFWVLAGVPFAVMTRLAVNGVACRVGV